MAKLEELKREFKKLYGRMPHYKWGVERIQEEIDKKKEVVQEVEVPEVDPIKPEEAQPTQPQSGLDPMLVQLLAGQQQILGKVVESLDQIKESMNDIKKMSPEETKKAFDESLKNTHFEAKYTYEIYALKHRLPDGSEERGLTGKIFNSEKEANAFGATHFGPSKYKLLRTKKPRLVENKKSSGE